ncbi:hypothetical protein O7622_09240 [Micromonospora sp. WMMD1076]|uniref:hypothetical protein n=1 Tax=Micromonospora sp. WMMD1076 TaxID=3016103 RepID=UPI00249C963D|nr:hypothetical protein [Micromonospora sp. WMMD1076]WFF08712.1 hypothetical protein O7622_09240 [Micromonospora sp. WMMD1076]
MNTPVDGPGDGAASLAGELRALRKGFGINGQEWVKGVGPGLRHISGVSDAESAAVTRKKIIAALDRLTRRLDPPRSMVARVALGFGSFPNARYLNRLAALEPKLDRSNRSLQRYSNEVLDMLADFAVAEELSPPGQSYDAPWQTEALRVTLLLDGPGIDVTEIRAIQSNNAGLARIEHSITVPAVGSAGPLDPAALHLRAVSGAGLGRPRLVTARRVVFDVQFPRVLDLSETHEFGFRVRLPVMSPFYLCTPIYPCGRFELKVRFDRERLPNPIRVVDGAFAHEAADPGSATQTVGVDRAGQVRRVFRDLRPGRSYGLHWQPAAD